MAKEMLTDKRLRGAIPNPGTDELTLYDGGNRLALRVRRSRDSATPARLLKTWLLIFYEGGKRTKRAIGTYPQLSLTDARKAAGEVSERTAAGVALPAPRKGGTKALLATGPIQPTTVAELFDRWLTEYCGRLHKDKGERARSLYGKHIGPVIGKAPLLTLKKLHVQAVLSDMRVKGATDNTLNGQLGLMRQAFRWGVGQDFIAVDPTFALSKAEFKRTGSRDRWLTEPELLDLAHKLQASRRAGPAGRQRNIPVLAYPMQAAVWVLLSTLARVGELSAADWSAIDFEAGTWHIPETKMGRPHMVHLSPFAVRHLKHLRAYAPESTWVLPNRDDTGPLDDQAVTKQLTDRQAQAGAHRAGRSGDSTALRLAGGRWTAHDLRRTGATMMRAMGCDVKVIERCLNHLEANELVRTYQRADLLPERKAAFAALGARLDELVPPAATAHLPAVR